MKCLNMNPPVLITLIMFFIQNAHLHSHQHVFLQMASLHNTLRSLQLLKHARQSVLTVFYSFVCTLIATMSSQRCCLYRKPFAHAIMFGKGNKGPMGPSPHSTRWMISFIAHYDYLLLQSQQAHTLSPSTQPKGASPHSFISQEAADISHLSLSFFFFLPQPAFFVCQQVIKICLLLPQKNTVVGAAAAEPRSWMPLLHADELSMDKIHDNTR